MMRGRALQAVAVALSAVIVVATVWVLFEARPRAVSAIPVALVNLDEPVTIGEGEDESLVAAGRSLAAELTRGSDNSIDWTLVGPDALDAVSDHPIVVTIPEDFSATVSGLLQSEPGQGVITIDADPSASLGAARVAATVSEAAVVAFNDDIAASYIENVFVSQEGLAEAVAETAAGASSLADGANDLADGTSEFASEMGEFATSAASVSAANGSYVRSVAALADGASSAAAGAASLESGLEQLDAGGASLLTARTSGVATDAAALAAVLASLSASCNASGANAGYCTSIANAATQSSSLAFASGVADATADEVAAGIAGSSSGASDLAESTAELASGARSLASAGTDVSSASSQLSGGANDLAAASQTIADGQVEIADAATALDDGIATLEEALPVVEDVERESVAESLATSTALLGVSSPLASDAVGAVAAALGLWVGALLLFARRKAVPNWAIAADARPMRATVMGIVPAVLFSAISAIAIWVTLLVVGVLDAPVATLGLLLLGSVAVAAIAQSVVAVGGRHAMWLLALLAIVQLAAAGLILPIETAPEGLQEWGALLPLSVLMTALRDASAGLAVGLQPAFALAVWTVVAIAATATATRLAVRRDIAE